MNIGRLYIQLTLCIGIVLTLHAQAAGLYQASGALSGVVEEQVPAQQKEESVIKKCLEGDVQLPNAETVLLSDEPIIHHYNGTLKLVHREKVPLPEGTDDKYAQPAACALLTLVSDDGCTISVDGVQWLQESKKGHDISQGRRDYSKVLSPGEHPIKIEYSQTYYDPQSGKKDLDGISLVVSTIPVNIRISGDESMLGEHEKTLIKQNDSVYFTLAPEWKNLPCMHQDIVIWEYRQLLGKNKKDPYGPWKAIGINAKGTKFSHKWAMSGIFQIRALVGNIPFTYVRSMDVKYRFSNSSGKENSYLKIGQPNFIGVVSNNEELLYARKAASNLGQTHWAWSKPAPNWFDFKVDSNIPPIAPSYVGSPKCNIFVYGMAFYVTLRMSLMDRGWGRADCPPTCDRLYDAAYVISRLMTKDITGGRKYQVTWSWVDGINNPVPGRVITSKSHTGVIDYDGTWISAGSTDINKSMHMSQDNDHNNDYHYRKPIKTMK